jgi:hypothetical protein
MAAPIMVLIIVVIVTSIGAWVLKQRVKKDMKHGLGRDVSDSELTSISAWMKVPPEKQGLSSYSPPAPNQGLIGCFRCGAPNYHWAQACHHCAIPFVSGPPPGSPYQDPR